MVALALLFGTAAAAIILARVYHLGVAAALVAILLGLPGLYLAWVGIKDARRDAVRGESLPKAADQLAVAVREQWDKEARVRDLNDPYPLAVSWAAADASLADGWDVLVTLASRGPGWPSPPPPGTWASGPDGLSGGGRDLVEVLTRVPTGRLVVLGEPGAGKTMLMVGLVLNLLEGRPSGGPVPVFASLASWNPENQDLHAWLAAQLIIDNPALAAPAPPGAGERTRIEALLEGGLILPILDGLDEIPDAVRGSAITQINKSLRPGEHLVVSCRTEQYRDAVRPPTGVEVTLRAAAAVQLFRLDTSEVSRYLRDSAGGPNAAARWDPVRAALGTQAPVGQALVTPLMVGLASAIYNPRPGVEAGESRNPAELCKPDLADRTAVESHLFDAFIPAAYRQPDKPGRWTAKQAETWLVFLARHLEHTIDSPDLAWWQLRQAVPRASRIAVGLVFGLGAALTTGFLTFSAHGLVFGLVAGLVLGVMAFAVTSEESHANPARGLGISVGGTAMSFAGGIVSGLVDGLLIGLPFGLVTGLVVGLLFGLADGLTVGLTVGFFVTQLAVMGRVGLTRVPSDLAAAASPQAVLARDRRVALRLVTGIGLWWWLFVGVMGGGLLPGLMFGFISGLAAGDPRTAWPSYMFARVWLVLRRGMPWSLMGFLADAHQRGVLRQVGAVYQFRHIELQHRLAAPPDRPTAS
jgi:hypothetical protein